MSTVNNIDPFFFLTSSAICCGWLLAEAILFLFLFVCLQSVSTLTTSPGLIEFIFIFVDIICTTASLLLGLVGFPFETLAAASEG